jgi:hypothetical protein
MQSRCGSHINMLHRSCEVADTAHALAGASWSQPTKLTSGLCVVRCLRLQ